MELATLGTGHQKQGPSATRMLDQAMEVSGTTPTHRHEDQALSLRSALTSALGDVAIAEERVRAAQEELRRALLSSAHAHRRAARLAIMAADANAVEQHTLLANEDSLSARCIPVRDV
jgi:hypothetical protein